jgi:hypothetical protein
MFRMRERVEGGESGAGDAKEGAGGDEHFGGGGEGGEDGGSAEGGGADHEELSPTKAVA